MDRQKVFVSFDYENDAGYRRILSTWENKTDFDFSVNDLSLEKLRGKSITSVKQELERKMAGSEHTLVIIGKNSNSLHPNYREIGYSNWQNFEIARSKKLGHKIITVKLDQSYNTPEELLHAGAKRASFNIDSIISALVG